MAFYKKVLTCITLLFVLLTPAVCRAALQAETKPTATSAPAKWLAGVLKTTAASLNEEAKKDNSDAAALRASLGTANEELQSMQMRVAMLKTGMEVNGITPALIGAILGKFSAKARDLSSRLDNLNDEIKEVKQRKAEHDASRSVVERQIEILKSSHQPGAWTTEIAVSFNKYAGAGAAFTVASNALVDALGQNAATVKQEKQLVDGVLPGLTKLQQGFVVDLLHQGRSKPILEQIPDLLRSISGLPRQAWSGCRGLSHCVRIRAFLLKDWARLLGLLLFICFLGWAARQVKGRLEPLMAFILSHSSEIGVRILVSIACALLAMAYSIAFILWLVCAYCVLGLFSADAALILLYVLSGFTAFGILSRVIKDLFYGTVSKNSCIVLINPGAARSFCSHLQLLSAYVSVGCVFIAVLGLDRFPLSMKLLVTQIYYAGVLLWTCFLLRPGYLKKVIDRPISPKWSKWLGYFWTALLLVLIGVCFLELLGFQSFSIYVVNAVVLTESLIAGVVFVAVTGKGVLKEIFERERVLLHLFGDVGLHLRQLYLPARMLLAALLIAGFVSGILVAWGIGFASLLAFVGQLSRGVVLGSLHLSPVTILASSFILYAVFRGSKLFRTFLRSRVFPRTGWDLGVQYSISTVLQYAIIIGGVLLAMNILGFPLASLTLLAGALGIGAGLGLQGVIANFVSGLVLLFERPVKVGDMLVIDGQWGEVKSINMRSTVFQNMDRSVLIIPNSDLLSAKIINWNHYGAGPNRLTLSVGVSYSSDVRMVTRLLQQICLANPRVLKDPAPQIFFEAYGDSSLNFSVRVFVPTAKDRVPTTHEINTAIFEVFQEKGIEMPFPQRDLHIIDERKCMSREGEELSAPLVG
ncbi:MAG: mechanosensitive ion channel domain-containing protein [Syntrophobacteraceae bacterium]